MFQRRSFIASLAFGLVAVSGCLGAGTSLINPGSPSITVTASILSASLAQDCPTTRSEGALAARCAPRSSDAGVADSACGGGFCQQSNMQLSLNASAGSGTLDIRVVSVRLLDASTGAAVDTLTSREPQSWSGSSYLPWDGVLEASENLRASYKLSAPNWSGISGTRPSFAYYGRRYVLEVTLSVGGVSRVLRSSEITREPEVVT